MNKVIGLIGLIGLISPISAQETADSAVVAAKNDSVIERTVTVEREFQPTVKAAGKLAVKPQAFEPKIEETTVKYSEFSSPLSIEKNVHTLGYASTSFNRPYSPRGFLRGGVGHPNTMLDFNYRVDSESTGSASRGRKTNEGWLDLHANHFGQWGRKMLEKSNLGLDYSYNFDNAQLYFSAEGGSEYFAHYYRYIDPTNPAEPRFKPGVKLSNFNKSDFSAFWNADAKIGVQNVPGADILYRVQTGYEGFFITGLAMGTAMEHQIHSNAMFEWSRNDHHVGLEADVKNRFYTGTTLTGKHQIHIEPYYAYEGERIRVHAGANLDLGLGGYGRQFGASPNVHFEADITKTWLTFFLDAKGELAAEGIRDELSEHRFLDVQNLLDVMTKGCCAAYTPVDAVAGLRFKPLPTLLFDVHAGYALTLDEHVLGYDGSRFMHFEQDQQIAKAGASLHYHYQDIFTMEISGDYFFGASRELLDPVSSTEVLDLEQGDWDKTMKNVQPYGKPKWLVHARFDGRIDRHWSLYSDNYLVGSRTALLVGYTGTMLAVQPDVKLKPYFDLNLGVEYTYNDRLSFFAQLNNYLAWTAKLTGDVLYGTPAQGANCLFGVNWNF